MNYRLNDLQEEILARMYYMRLFPEKKRVKSSRVIIPLIETVLSLGSPLEILPIKEFKHSLYKLCFYNDYYECNFIDGVGNLGEDCENGYISDGAGILYTEVRLNENGAKYVEDNQLMLRFGLLDTFLYLSESDFRKGKTIVRLQED